MHYAHLYCNTVLLCMKFNELHSSVFFHNILIIMTVTYLNVVSRSVLQNHDTPLCDHEQQKLGGVHPLPVHSEDTLWVTITVYSTITIVIVSHE